MVWIASLVFLALMVTVPALAQQPGPTAPMPGEVRHSGRIVEVAPDASSIVVEEIVAWSGPGTGVVMRSIRITPRTSIRALMRTDRWDGTQTSMPGWASRLVDEDSLRTGDFVTVTTDDDARDVAVSLEVIRSAA